MLVVTELVVDFCGEQYRLDWTCPPFVIGREGDLQVDDNPFLHRHFLRLVHAEGIWWIENLGSRLAATITDPAGAARAWLAPGSRLPLVFAQTTVVFTAGATTYEFCVSMSVSVFELAPTPAPGMETTLGSVSWTPSQRLLIVALAEPMLRRAGTEASALPSSAQAAQRLGWPLTTFNRKLDNVCDKLDRAGVRGLRGHQGALASNRRARLVEHAVTSRLVTQPDLALLPAPVVTSGDAPEVESDHEP